MVVANLAAYLAYFAQLGCARIMREAARENTTFCCYTLCYSARRYKTEAPQNGNFPW